MKSRRWICVFLNSLSERFHFWYFLGKDMKYRLLCSRSVRASAGRNLPCAARDPSKKISDYNLIHGRVISHKNNLSQISTFNWTYITFLQQQHQFLWCCPKKYLKRNKTSHQPINACIEQYICLLHSIRFISMPCLLPDQLNVAACRTMCSKGIGVLTMRVKCEKTPQILQFTHG